MKTAAPLLLALSCALAACGDASPTNGDTSAPGLETGTTPGRDAAPSDAPVAPGDDSAPTEGGAPAGDSNPPGPDLPPPPSCADECFVGQTRSSGSTTQTCALYSDTSKAFIALGGSLRDRARRHEGWMRRFHLPNGYVAEAFYADSNHDKVVTYGGYSDAAIWTGTYLAAEALRYQVTRSSDALANVKRLVAKIDELFELTGHPGYMARFWAPTQSGDAAIDGLYNASNGRHHAASYKGQPMF